MKTEDFKRLIIQWQPVMRRTAESLLKDTDQAADIVQDTVISLWEKRDELAGIQNPKAFCITTVKRRCIDLLRKQSPTEPIDENTLLLSEPPEDDFEERYRQAKLVIDQLPDKQRKVILMKYEDGLPNETIEKTLQISSNNLYTILSRAYQSIRETINRQNNTLR